MPLTVAQICSLPPETGRCRASMKRFFFNATSRKCEEFRFGGCEGNANRFDSEEECQDYCGCKLAGQKYLDLRQTYSRSASTVRFVSLSLHRVQTMQCCFEGRNLFHTIMSEKMLLNFGAKFQR